MKNIRGIVHDWEFGEILLWQIPIQLKHLVLVLKVKIAVMKILKMNLRMKKFKILLFSSNLNIFLSLG